MGTLRERKRQLYTAMPRKFKTPSGNEEKVSHECAQLYKLQISHLSKDFYALSEVLFGEDRFLLSKALKNKWFFRYVIENDLKCIENVLLNASRYSRLRILEALNKYSWNEQQCDVLYGYVRETLGIDYASSLLPSCSKNLIEYEIMEGFITDLRCSQISFVYRKSPSAASLYLELFAIKNHRRIVTEKANYLKKYLIDLFYTRMTPIAKFLKSIVCTDTKYVLSYYKKYADIFPTNRDYNSCYCLTFGRKQTKVILSKEKQYILNNSRDFATMLHLPTVRRKLTCDEFKKYFHSFLPDNPATINWDKLFRVAKHIKASDRIEMLRSSYMQKYNKNLLDDNEFSLSVWPKCLDKDLRHDWALDKISKVKTENELEELNLYKYCYPQVAMPKFVEKFPLLSLDDDIFSCEDYVSCIGDMYVINDESEELFDFMLSTVVKIYSELNITVGLEGLHEKILVFKLAPHKWLKLQSTLTQIGIYDSSDAKFSALCFLNDFIYRNVAYGDEIPDVVINKFVKIISSCYTSYIKYDIPVEQSLYIDVAIRRFDIVVNKLTESESWKVDELMNIVKSVLIIMHNYTINAKSILRKYVPGMIEKYKTYLALHIEALANEDLNVNIFYFGQLRLLVIDQMLNLSNHQKSYMLILNNKPEILTNNNLLKCLQAEKTKRPQMTIFYDSLRCFYFDLHKDLLTELENLFLTSKDNDKLSECAYAIARLKPREEFQAWVLEMCRNGYNSRIGHILKYIHRIRPVLSIDFLIKIMRKYPRHVPKAVLISICNQLPSKEFALFVNEINIIFNNPKEFQYI